MRISEAATCGRVYPSMKIHIESPKRKMAVRRGIFLLYLSTSLPTGRASNIVVRGTTAINMAQANLSI